jgi:hypothetical protein
MRKKITLILFGLFLSMGLALAQNKITGTVLEDTGEPCIGATVMIQGTKQGTKTDLDGHFTIAVPAGKKLGIRTLWRKRIRNLPTLMKLWLSNVISLTKFLELRLRHFSGIALCIKPSHEGSNVQSPRWLPYHLGLFPVSAASESQVLQQFAEAPRAVVVLDENGEPMKAGDPHRFFEASWMHKYNGKYYFSYSTGDSHYLCYAIGDSPYGPFRYKGIVLDPVVGWTTHHSIVEFKGQWYLCYHDCVPSNDITHLRSLKIQRLYYNADGTIQNVVND